MRSHRGTFVSVIEIQSQGTDVDDDEKPRNCKTVNRSTDKSFVTLRVLRSPWTVNKKIRITGPVSTGPLSTTRNPNVSLVDVYVRQGSLLP